MNRLLIPPSAVTDDGAVELDPRQSEHLIRVLGAHPGQTLRAALLGVGRASAQVVEIRDGVVHVRLEVDAEPPPTSPPVRLILALPRPKTVRRIVQDATSLGVTQIDLINAWRVEKSYFDSPMVAPDRLRHAAILGAEQAGRHELPTVKIHRLFRPFVEGIDGDGSPLELVANPRTGNLVEDVTLASAVAPERLITVAIGPEGGWIERELDSWATAGFLSVSLGSGTLRSETAVSVALAQIELCRRLGVAGGVR